MKDPIKKPCVKLAAIGDGAGNIIRRAKSRLTQVDEFISLNTDVTSINGSDAGVTLRIGEQTTSEERKRIADAISGCGRLIVLACLGGTTGTRISPVVVEIARNLKIATDVIATLPFTLEGTVRSRQADDAIEVLRSAAENLVVLSNEEYRENACISFAETFAAVDRAVIEAIKKITD